MCAREREDHDEGGYALFNETSIYTEMNGQDYLTQRIIVRDVHDEDGIKIAESKTDIAYKYE